MVVDAVKNLKPMEALAVLAMMPKRAAEPVRKLLLSAIANAKAMKATEGSLSIKLFEVNEGPVMKRWRAVARGSGHGYKKRMSHMRIVLSDEVKEK